MPSYCSHRAAVYVCMSRGLVWILSVTYESASIRLLLGLFLILNAPHYELNFQGCCLHFFKLAIEQLKQLKRINWQKATWKL